ncbi:hypothetical protein Patl1_09465 [Pistacia atlantica]|uniref:Uncharacterized protein n=1 Tax=Pistacia atlantica TaxID=434234 RepID=A0ACC1AIC4_9ROSI|nr:hypothetical protein Patl1_09465 [Pistacia atlantica]
MKMIREKKLKTLQNPALKVQGVDLQVQSRNPKISFEEVLTEAVRQRSQDLPANETSQQSSGSRVAEVLRSPNLSQKNSWKSLVDKTKSRLSDPPEEEYDRSGRSHEHEEDDIGDIQDDFRKPKFNTLTILQWLSLFVLIGALICNLSVPFIKGQKLWDLPLWKWEIMLLAVICGRLVSGWGIRVVVIFLERNFLWRKRVLYFVYGLRKAVQNCLWLGLVLFAWNCIFNRKVEQETKSKILPYVSRTLVCFLVGTLIWLLKTLLVKVLASSFHVNTYFERIQEALFNQYVIETLSGPPWFDRRITQEEGAVPEIQEVQNAGATMPGDPRTTLLPRIGNGKPDRCCSVGRKPRFSKTMSGKQDHKIPIDQLHKMNQKNISAWNMKRMINIISHGSLSTLDEQILNSDMEDDSSLQIKNECQAKEAAKKIFQKVAKPWSSTKHLLGAPCENEGISKEALNIWLVNVFKERKALALSLNDTKTAVDELHNMLNIIVSIIIFVIWLAILGIPISHFLVFISSQVLLVAFIFGNTCRTVFEAIIFLFIMHPYDVGDRCEVDGVQMIVEEMNILTTVFLRYDNQKIKYPNSVLATKPIGNFYRSPDMYETIEFCVHISTQLEKISTLRERILGYVESKRDHWHPSPLMVVTEVEDMNKVKILMWVQHRLNFQNPGERVTRRAQLIEEMIRAFKDLGIEYRMLPLDVNVRNMPNLTSNRLPSNWTACAANGI